jgi:hypothetical protein
MDMLLIMKSRNGKESNQVKVRKNKVFWITLFLLFLTMNVYAESAKQTNSVFAVGNTQFKILNVSLGEGLNAGGMILAPVGKTNKQTCLIIEIEEIAGNVSPIIKCVTDEKKVTFDKKACVSSKNNLKCAVAVNKTSHSFTLNFSNGMTINLSSFMK